MARMRPRLLTLTAGVAIVLAACSSGSPTQAPGAATQAPGQTADGGGGGATDVPAATSDSGGGGGGGGGGSANGSVQFEISGPESRSGDFGFVPAGSLFGGAQGSSLSFANPEATEIVSILISADGSVVVSYGGLEFSAPGATCKTSNWNIGASSASGSFDCDASLIITAAGAQLTGGKIKGSFTAHA